MGMFLLSLALIMHPKRRSQATRLSRASCCLGAAKVSGAPKPQKLSRRVSRHRRQWSIPTESGTKPRRYITFMRAAPLFRQNLAAE